MSELKGRGLTIGLAALALGGAALAVRQPPRRNRRPPRPSKPVELGRYLGLWHEFGRYENGFERGCEAVTAEYRLRADGLIEVINTCGEKSAGPGSRRAVGRARVLPDSDGAMLKVSFFRLPLVGPVFLGDYWVLDHGEDYDWSIVGEPSGRYLWILTRDAQPAESLGQDLIKRAAAMGYDMERFRLTRQSAFGQSAFERAL